MSCVGVMDFRTNRNKGKKILRCFPHCCPEHIDRGYCGSAIHVEVSLIDPSQLDAEQREQATLVQVKNPSAFVVFSRFAEAEAPTLSVGDRLAPDAVIKNIQTERTPTGTWFQGTVVESNKENCVTQAQDTCVFEVNENARWYYDWESTARKAQRFTKHVLRAYIFEKTCVDGYPMLSVVALATSAPFKIVSFRRAPVSDRQESARSGEGASKHTDEPDTRRLDAQDGGVCHDCNLWERRHQDVMTSAKHLFIVYLFLRRVDAVPSGGFLQQWSDFFEARLDSPVSRELDTTDDDYHSKAAVSWSFLGRLVDSQSVGAEDDNGSVVQDKLAQLVHVCVDLAGWLTLDNENFARYRRFIQSQAGNLLDLRAVRKAYVQAVYMISELVDRFTGWTDDSRSSQSLALLAEAIMEAVFTHEPLKPLRRVLMGVLTSGDMFGMQSFVAQLRSEYVLQQRKLSLDRGNMESASLGYTSAFEGAWGFDSKRSVLTPLADTASSAASMGCLVDFMRELARIEIRCVDGQSFEVCSMYSLTSGVLAEENNCEEKNDPAPERSGMVLICDNRYRVFAHFPSGLSSMIPLGAHGFGDYRAKIVSPACLVLEFSCWPSESTTPGTLSLPPKSLRLKVKVEVTGCMHSSSANGSPTQLEMDGVIDQAPCRTYDGNQIADFQTIPVTQKYQAVEAWRPVMGVKCICNQLDASV